MSVKNVLIATFVAFTEYKREFNKVRAGAIVTQETS